MAYETIERFMKQYQGEEGTSYPHRWHYIESCILKGYLDHYQLTGSEDDYTFVKSFVDRLYDEMGTIPSIDVRYFNIDQIRMANVLFPLYEREGDPKYKRVLDLLYGQLETYPRTKAGSFWHKTNYPNQVWLDGLYMGQPFYVHYVKKFADRKDYSDTLQQFRNVRAFIYNDAKKLYSHAYDESREMFWCDPATGQSPHVWGRAVGWYVMALVDVRELLEGESADAGFLEEELKAVIDDMLPHQHESGMWHQVVDMGREPGNYLESSGTLMLAYAILKGVRLGYLPKEYAEYGQKAFDGTIQRYLREENGTIRLGGICKSAGLGKHPETGVVRDGSFAYYISGEPVVENNGHGVAPLFMAYTEVLRQQG